MALMENSLIAVVEDDREIRTMVVELLAREGFAPAGCKSVEEFDRLLERQRVDLVVLDVMLPGEDGLSLCRRLRSQTGIPVLMVTAKAEDVDRIVGLEVGADDYLPKPFNPRELIARVRAILRRTREANRVTAPLSVERYRFAGWNFDAGCRSLLDPDGTSIELTGGEFDLLVSFVTHPHRVLNRDQLLDWTRGRNAVPYDRSIDVQLSRLRRKLAQHPSGEALIKTVRGGGYVFAQRVDKV
ncbi:response regulator [Sphingomonas sp.]|uniref:response regulator n=1 Tax=Sphingomonas sp. TaxID=28214 RepID=UPI0035C81C77